MLIAAAALTACSKSEDIVIDNTSDKVTFTATVDAPASRSVLVEENGKYHAEWAAGDYIELYEISITGGTKAKANNKNTTLTEGGKTAKVSFELAKKDADSFAYILAHNDASINGAATYLAFTVPSTQAPAAMNTYDAAADLIISKGVELPTQPTAAVNFEMGRVTAVAKVTIKNLGLAEGDAVQRVNFSCQQTIAGKKTYLMTDDIIAGIDPLTNSKDADVQNNVNVALPEAQTGNFSYYMSIWPATLAVGENYSVKIITTAGKEYVKEGTIAKDLVFTSGNITAFTVNMAGIGEDIDTSLTYVEVAVIKWATSNLEYEVNGITSKGFATGWCIAPSQEHHFYIGGAEKREDISSYDRVAHFNFGGIGNGALHIDPASAVHLDGSIPFDFSGKMYTDQDCTAATTDFAAAKYGDVAYWASNGQYRMPSKADMETLYNNACRTLASYNGVAGTYFYNPAEGETAGVVDGTKGLTDADLEVGLFLPNAGRGYDNKDYTLYNINALGMYRTSTVQENSKTGVQGYGVVSRPNKLTETCDFYSPTIRGTDPKTYAYGACGRYCIRPIYIAE
jgi:hypothetical protein